jgi:hypothetical protein
MIEKECGDWENFCRAMGACQLKPLRHLKLRLVGSMGAIEPTIRFY